MEHGLFKDGDESTELQVEYTFIDSTKKLLHHKDEIESLEGVIGLDTETTGLDPYLNHIVMLQLSDGDKTFVIDARTADIHVIKPFLETSSFVMHNASFDYSMLRGSKIALSNVYCTMVGEQVVSAGKRFGESYKLNAVANKRLGIVLDKDPSTSFLTIGDAPFSEIQKLYGARDAFILPEIRNQQLMDADEYGLHRILDLEMNCIIPISEMQLRGCVIDKEKWMFILQYAHVFENRVGKKLKEVFEEVDMQPTLFGMSSINLNSQPQLLKMMRRFGLDLESTSSVELEDHLGEHVAVDWLLEYRTYEKVRAAYGDELLKKINPITGRLHPKFNQARAKTGRMSSSQPNAQNIPAPKELQDKLVEIRKSELPSEVLNLDYTKPTVPVDDTEAKASDRYTLIYEKGIYKYYIDSNDAPYIYVYDFRDCFISAPGRNIVQCDMPKAEICIMAHMSQDKKLIEAINSGEDVYKRAAAESLHIAYDAVVPAQRKIYKAVVLGLAYGLSSFGLARNIKITEDHANEVINNFKGAFPVLNSWLEKEGKAALMRCYALTQMGRRLFLPFDIDPTKDPMEADLLRMSNERRGKNHPMQGGNADLTKLALAMIHKEIVKRKLNAGLQLVVHDEFVGEAVEDQAEEMGQIMVDKVQEAFKMIYPSVIVKPEYNIGKYWVK